MRAQLWCVCVFFFFFFFSCLFFFPSSLVFNDSHWHFRSDVCEIAPKGLLYFLQILMEGILNGANGRNVLQIVNTVVGKVSHEHAPTQNQREMEEPVRNRDLGNPFGVKNAV